MEAHFGAAFPRPQQGQTLRPTGEREKTWG